MAVTIPTDVAAQSRITVATPADRAAVMETLVATFRADPVLRFLFPDEDTYPRYAEAFFGPLFDKRVGRQTVFTLQNGAAVSMWDSPAGAQSDGSLPQTPGSTYELPAAELARTMLYDEVVHQALPAEPFWYLGVLGTHPDHAGKRWGRAVMEAGLLRAKESGLPAILETSNPGNVALSQRSGWRIEQELTLDPLTIWIMRWW